MKNEFPRQFDTAGLALGNSLFSSYLILGDDYALIEPGIRISAKQVVSQFEQLNLDAQRLKYIFVLHAHPDHTTGLPVLMEAFPQAKIVGAGSAEKPLLREKVWRNFYIEDQEINQVLYELGMVESVFDAEYSDFTHLQLDILASEGAAFDLGRNLTLEIMSTPGHSPCSLSIYIPEKQFLFISDAAGFVFAPNQVYPCFFYHKQQYFTSLQRLKQKKAFFLATGHGDMCTGHEAVQEYLKRSEEAGMHLAEEISRHLDQGQEPSEVASTLMNFYYRDFLKIYSRRNLQGCMDALVKQVLQEQQK